MRALARAAGALACAAALGAAAARPAAAQDTRCDDAGDVEVVGLDFQGNRAFTDATLAQAVVTTPSSWVRRHTGVLGTRRCIERGEVRLDAVRLGIFYRKHGYPDVRVDTLVREYQPGALMVDFRIEEGSPLRIRTLTITGLDSVPERAAVLRNLSIGVGSAFDQIRVDSARNEIVARLRDGGYPFADVLRSSSTSLESRSATVTFDVVPGARSRIGRVEVVAEPRKAGQPIQISSAVVRRLVGIRRGALYRASDLNDAQRALYRTDAYEHVDIRLVPDTVPIDSVHTQGDSAVTVRISLLEQRLRSASLGAGFGTLDCFRLTGQLTDRNIGHQASRLDLDAQVSKIGVGRPLDGTSAFCRALSGTTNQANADPYSETLNYHLGATFQPRALFGFRTLPSLALYTEVRSEYKAYLRRTPVGAALSLDVTPRPSIPMTLGYQFTIGRTTAAPAFFCAVFSRCDNASRGELERNRRLGTVSLAARRVRTDAAFDASASPTRGTAVSAALRHASRLTRSDPNLQFTSGTGDGAWYLPVGGGVFATRLRLGTIFGASLSGVSATVPTEERLYAGGPTTVRGFGQNELGPAVYTVIARDTTIDVGGASVPALVLSNDFRPERVIPVGGNSLAVGNLEYRSRRFGGNLLQYVVFTDVGQVWNRGRDSLNLNFNNFKVTPGMGVRIYTTLGFTFRVDVGYNGYQRAKGALFYSDPLGSGAQQSQVYCVQPGVPVSRAEARSRAEAGSCVGFVPRTNNTFLRRLTPSFSIGQAF